MNARDQHQRLFAVPGVARVSRPVAAQIGDVYVLGRRRVEIGSRPMSDHVTVTRWTGIGIWHQDEPIVLSVFPGELVDKAVSSCEPTFPFEVWCTHADAATPLDAEAALVLAMWQVNGYVWPEHTNDLGDWCPWSGQHDGRDDDRCPACCRNSQTRP